MTKEVNDVKLTDINVHGEFIYVFSDRFNIVLFCFDREDNSLYRITTDKSLIVERIEEVTIPSSFEKHSLIKFFKAEQLNNEEYIYNGIIVIDGVASRFSIDRDCVFRYGEKTIYINQQHVIKQLSSLKNIDIYSYVQRKEKLYVVGYDEQYGDYICAIISMATDSITKMYSIFTDYGSIIPLSINVDIHDNRIYVCGKIEYLDNNDNVIEIKPYFDSFLLS